MGQSAEVSNLNPVTVLPYSRTALSHQPAKTWACSNSHTISTPPAVDLLVTAEDYVS